LNSDDGRDLEERTRLICDVTRRPTNRRPVNPPISRATTLLMPEAATMRDAGPGPTYGIVGLEAQNALAAALAELEGARRVFLLPTGLAALTVAAQAMLQAGDEVLVTDAVYGPTRRFCDRFLKRFGVAARYFPPRADAQAVLALAGPRTRLILMESPGSLTFELQDVPAVAAAAAERGIPTLVDNTWAAGLLFKPLAHGVTLSVQALSKYVGGHSDVFGGSVAVSDPAVERRVQQAVDDLGWYVSPDDAWLTLRGLRTLAVRLPAHADAAAQVMAWLQLQPEVARVLSPALPGSPDHALWRRDYTGSNGLFGVVLRPAPPAAAHALLDALRLFGLGFSWGGFESLATFEDPQLGQRRRHQPLEGPLLRLHVGLEAPADLITDLRRGLDAYAAARAAAQVGSGTSI
jgi:cysteine-S-conjugate beta-lyase